MVISHQPYQLNQLCISDYQCWKMFCSADMECISIEYLITPHTNKISKQELIISYLISQ